MAKLLESSHHWMSPTMADAGGRGGTGNGGGALFPSMFPEPPMTTSQSFQLQQQQEKPKQIPLDSVVTTLTSSQPSSLHTTKSLNAPSTSTVATLNNTSNTVSETSYYDTTILPLSATNMTSNIMTINSSISNANGMCNTSSISLGSNRDQDASLITTGERDGVHGAQIESLRGEAAMAAPKSGVSRWTQSDLLAALSLVRAGTPIKPAAERCNIPVMTLWRRTRALGIVSSKVQCGFRYPAARRRSRTEPDHSTRIKLMNQYTHAIKPEIEADITLTNTSITNISPVKSLSRSIETEIVETNGFSTDYTITKIEDESNTKIPFTYPKKEFHLDNTHISMYNKTDLYEAYRDRSPSISLPNRHQSGFTKENSPFRQKRENSPSISDRENGNVSLLKEMKPRTFGRENSPLRLAREYSPKRSLKENSPLPPDRENSPFHSIKEMSPRPMLRENSPRPHNKPSTSHSKINLKEFSPKPSNKGSISHQLALGSVNKMKVFTREASPRPLLRAPLPNSANGRTGRSDRFRAWVDIVLEGAVKNTHQQEHPQDLSNHQNRHQPSLVTPTPLAVSKTVANPSQP
ncbi:unnamed protein product [Meganyctiphanes norvegica]|uniref:HTH psq-type domain-containing protein n=1 Tax=Meganyctiphanes norvegica TaxID=48144 RepID=A0AAV2QN05_MEGNR